MTAPAMPKRIVTIIPPGSFPGMINLASAPAISPTMIQNNKAVSIRYHLSFWDAYNGCRIYPRGEGVYTFFDGKQGREFES